MLKAEQVPIEVMNEFHAALAHDESYTEAITAAINAWPGFEYRADVAFPAFGHGPAAIILPLPQEPRDE